MISVRGNIISIIKSVSLKLKGRLIRKLVLGVGCLIVFYSNLVAQITYTSIANGNWNTNTTWNPSGIPMASDFAIISGGHNVTVTTNAACASVTFAGENANNTLTINNLVSLTVSGIITIPRASNNPYVNTVAVGSGNLITGSIAFTNGNISPRHLMTISTGTVTVYGNVTEIGSNGSASIIFTGSGLLKLGGAFLTAATGTLTPATGTVEYNATVAQNVGDFTYNNLTFSGGGAKTLLADVTVNGILNLTLGNINTGSNVLILTQNTTGSLVYTSGTIIGKFRRGVITTGVPYLFPVGTASFYRPAIFNFSSLGSSTNIIAQFIGASPGSFTPYNDDGTNPLDYAFTDGYWNFSSNITPANTYSLSLDGDGFSSYTIDANSRISGRNAGSIPWQDFGTHGIVSGTTITRTGINNLNATSFDYCFAGRCTAANAGSDVAICGGSSTTLNGSGGGTYFWSPAYGLSNPNIANPVASPDVTTTYTLSVTNGGCVKTDEVVVTVNPLPAAALGYTYQKTLTIEHTKVSGGSDLINFPVLINITATELRNIPAGHVENSSGFDIIFTDENYNRLDHQVEIMTR